jgi:hypothetical protein
VKIGRLAEGQELIDPVTGTALTAAKGLASETIGDAKLKHALLLPATTELGDWLHEFVSSLRERQHEKATRNAAAQIARAQAILGTAQFEEAATTPDFPEWLEVSSKIKPDDPELSDLLQATLVAMKDNDYQRQRVISLLRVISPADIAAFVKERPAYWDQYLVARFHEYGLVSSFFGKVIPSNRIFSLLLGRRPMVRFVFATYSAVIISIVPVIFVLWYRYTDSLNTRLIGSKYPFSGGAYGAYIIANNTPAISVSALVFFAVIMLLLTPRKRTTFGSRVLALIRDVQDRSQKVDPDIDPKSAPAEANSAQPAAPLGSRGAASGRRRAPRQTPEAPE